MKKYTIAKYREQCHLKKTKKKTQSIINLLTSWSNSNLLCDRPIIRMTLTMYGGGKDGSSITGNSTRLKLNKNRKNYFPQPNANY